MPSIKNKLTENNQAVEETAEIDEFVNADGGIISGDKNTTSDSEIETGPVEKPFNDTSDYEKGVSTTTDRAARYRQNIPWFAVYSYGGSNNRGVPVNETPKVILTKDQLDEEIKEDLVKKNKNDREVWGKDYDGKVEKMIDIISDTDLSATQLEKIKRIVLDKLNKDNE
jgi:hypothetical protein